MPVVVDLAQINVRKGTAAQWTVANSLLAAGEFGLETDTKLVKLGDGTTLWNALDYQGAQIAAQIHLAVSKATLVDADEIPLSDSAATFGIKKITWANFKATLKTYFDTLHEAIGNYATIVTSVVTTTLTIASARRQVFTGTTAGQVVQLPNVTTLPYTGYEYKIANKSTQTIAVNSSGGNLIFTIPANTTVTFMCILLTGTTAASWSYDISGFTTAPGSKVVQIVSATYATDTTNSTTTLADTGLTATITPTSASNKILVFITQSYRKATSEGSGAVFTLNINGSDVLTLSNHLGVLSNSSDVAAWNYLDSPASTSAVIYKTRQAQAAGATGSISSQPNGDRSTIVLMEVTP